MAWGPAANDHGVGESLGDFDPLSAAGTGDFGVQVHDEVVELLCCSSLAVVGGGLLELDPFERVLVGWLCRGRRGTAVGGAVVEHSRWLLRGQREQSVLTAI